MVTPTETELHDRVGSTVVYIPEARKDPESGKYVKGKPERVFVLKVLPKGRGAIVGPTADHTPGWPAKLHELRLLGGY